MGINKALESALEELLASETDFTAETIEAWLQKYPQYRQEIIAFVSELRLQQRLPESAMKVNTSAISAEVLSGLQEEAVRRDNRDVPFRGIFAQAQLLGLRLESEADELGVNVHLLDMLDKRRVRADTVPIAFLGALAAKVQVSGGKLLQWLSDGAPRRPATMFGALTFRKPSIQSFEKAWKQSGLPVEGLQDWVSAAPAKK